jgi:hypothetical protein
MSDKQFTYTVAGRDVEKCGSVQGLYTRNFALFVMLAVMPLAYLSSMAVKATARKARGTTRLTERLILHSAHKFGTTQHTSITSLA